MPRPHTERGGSPTEHRGDTTPVAVKIRLKRMGKIRQPYYRIVVADSRTKRDGRVIEEIGKYHPKQDPSLIEVDSQRAQYWLGVGAQPSEPVMALLRKTGDWQQFKGEPAPPPLLVAEAKRDRNEVFNEALKESSGDTSSEATTTTRKRTAKKAAPAAEPTPEPIPVDAVPADETPDGATAAAEQAEVDAVDAEIKNKNG
jgi:small subunit ribosomal protein S16